MSTINVNQIVDSQGGVLAPISSVMRNRIINGAMTIDQRNAGAAVTINATANTYVMDRWRCRGETSDGVYTCQQVSEAPVGFKNSAKITVTTADASVDAGKIYGFQQLIEGFNFADLDWGTASAKSITISFWVRSSLTGTFGGGLTNGAGNRSYPFTYTISAANTWEQKSITIAGDTSGTWASTNTTALRLNYNIGAGSENIGTAGAWNSDNDFSATGAIDIINTLSATWQITGVQLEKGSNATGFEYRQYGQELALCQRYYWVICNGDNKSIANASAFTSSEVNCIIQNPVEMRTAPSLSSTSGSAYYNFRSGGGGQTFSTLNLIEAGTILSRFYSSTVTTTEGRAGYLKTNSASAFAAFSSEL